MGKRFVGLAREWTRGYRIAPFGADDAAYNMAWQCIRTESEPTWAPFPLDVHPDTWCVFEATDRMRGIREIQAIGESQARNERLAELGVKIGKLVQAKNLAYGDSAGNAGAIMRILYPNGVQPHQYDDALLVVRVLDKLSRIAQRGVDGKDKGGESPWADCAGYGVLGWAADIEAGRVKE